jgi:hypothetical protein
LLDANSELLAEVGDFIKQSTELQKWGPCQSKVWHVKNIILIIGLWSKWNFLCFVCLYLYLLDPHGCIIMQIKNYYIIKFGQCKHWSLTSTVLVVLHVRTLGFVDEYM